MATTSKNDSQTKNSDAGSNKSVKNEPLEAKKSGLETEKVLFSWKAAARPFQKRSREYWVTVISIASLLAFILFLAEGVMPVVLITSLIFLYYILSTVRPEDVNYTLTNWGVKIANSTTTWDNLTQFWFTKRMGSDLLVVETISFPFRLELIYDLKDKEKLKQTLSDYISEGSSTPNYLDKTVDWVTKKLPNE